MKVPGLKDLVDRRLKELGENKYQAAARAGLPPDAIRYVLDGRKPSLDRVKEICDALGLELYVGSPRPAVPTEIARALKLEGDCSIKDAVAAIESLANIMGAVQARADAALGSMIENNRRSS